MKKENLSTALPVVRCTPELRRKFRILAIKEGLTMAAITRQMIDQRIKKAKL